MIQRNLPVHFSVTTEFVISIGTQTNAIEGCYSYKSLIPPFHRGCDLCASLARPQNWPGRRWRHRGSRKVALATGLSRVAQRTSGPRHGRHGRCEVLSMFKTVAQRSPRRSVAHRSLKGGMGKAHASPWSQNGFAWVGHRSPRNIIRTVVNIVYQFEQCFCLPCTTTMPPLADQ